MNDYQEKRFTSNKLVVKIAKENPDVIKLIPDFEEGIEKQDEINNEIERVRTIQEQDTSGITKNKKFNIDVLRSQTLEISGAIYSCAFKINDYLLMGRVNFKTTEISRMRPGKIISTSHLILEEAKNIPAENLAKAGISASELSAYEEMVTYFKSISGSTREAQIDTSACTKKLIELFKLSSQLYKTSLDRLAIQFKSKAPEFYLKYHAARKSRSRGSDNNHKKDNSKNQDK